jgi:hypothetical protein
MHVMQALTLQLPDGWLPPPVFCAIIFCYAEFWNSLLWNYKAFIFASFGQKIVKMAYLAQQLFPVYLGGGVTIPRISAVWPNQKNQKSEIQPPSRHLGFSTSGFCCTAFRLLPFSCWTPKIGISFLSHPQAEILGRRGNHSPLVVSVTKSRQYLMG